MKWPRRGPNSPRRHGGHGGKKKFQCERPEGDAKAFPSPGVPAKAGIHFSVSRAADRWIPASAGTPGFLLLRIRRQRSSVPPWFYGAAPPREDHSLPQWLIVKHQGVRPGISSAVTVNSPLS